MLNRAILIKSCQKNRARRDAIDATWAGQLRYRGIQVIAIEGGHDRTGLGGKLWQLNSDDDYQDNSLKLAHALHYVVQSGIIDHLFICDDDTFIHPQRWLDHEPAGEFECRLYHPKTPQEHKLNHGRPWATGGAGWWMSRRMCELYVEHVRQRCSWDDVLAAGIAQDHNIPIIDRPDLYTCDRYGAGLVDDRAITRHPVEPAEMLEMWEATKEL